MEIFELKHDPIEQWVNNKPENGHVYYVGCQFHPEYLTRPLKPSPPFLGFILASSGLLKSYLESSSTNYGSESSNSEEIELKKDLSYTIHPIKGTADLKLRVPK